MKFSRMAWLRSIVSDDPARPLLHAPFRCEWEDGDTKHWFCATNGFAILALPALPTDPHNTDPRTPQPAPLFADAKRRSPLIQMKLSDLAAWSGSKGRSKCGRCNGDGYSRRSYKPCGVCGGTGRIVSRGTIGPATVDRRLLADVLRLAPKSEVSVHVGTEYNQSVVLRGDSSETAWVALLMPLDTLRHPNTEPPPDIMALAQGAVA